MNLHLLEQKYIINIILSIDEKPGRFNLLQKEFEINTSTLQKRLESLEGSVLIQKKPCSIDGRSCVYMITKKGAEIAKVLKELKTSCKEIPSGK